MPCKQKDFTEDFKVKYVFNAINEEYENAYYILTIKPSIGIEFPTTEEDLKKIKIHVSLNRLCSDFKDLYSLTPDATIDNSNLIITIPYSKIYKDITEDINCIIIDIYITVTIPYMIDNCIMFTNKQNFTCIKGAIDFVTEETISSGTTRKTLASLDNFCSCINFSCPNLIGIGKNLLC